MGQMKLKTGHVLLMTRPFKRLTAVTASSQGSLELLCRRGTWLPQGSRKQRSAQLLPRLGSRIKKTYNMLSECWLLGRACVCNHSNGAGWGNWSREKGSLGPWPVSHRGARIPVWLEPGQASVAGRPHLGLQSLPRSSPAFPSLFPGLTDPRPHTQVDFTPVQR